MKRSLSLFLLVIMLLSCNSGKKEKNFLIGVSQCSDDAWRRTMNEEILREAYFSADADVQIKTAYDSNQKQIRDIEGFVAAGVDLLIVSPNEAIPLTPVLEKAMKEGIPVVLVDMKSNSDQ